MRANILKDVIDVSKLTIGDALMLKRIFDLTDSEAVTVFLGGMKRENVQV